MVEEAAAKQEILKRIKSALGERVSELESDYAYLPRHYQVGGSLSKQARLELFVDRLNDYDATVYPCEESSIAETIGTALSRRNVVKVLTGQAFPTRWIPPCFEFSGDDDFTYDQIDSFEAVITPCALAIAETGTIILRHAGDEPRRAVSLIPDYHLCIVFARQVVETVAEGVRKMAAMGNAPLTTISGPSATADIEMTRVKGVHGPRTLDVILVGG
jgi:L-lactate dehydrogenase complex protein LldG